MIKKDLAIYIALSILASGLNYLSYPLLSRFLPDSEYVNITVSLSLLTQMGTFLSSIIAISISLSKEKVAKDNENDLLSALQTRILKMLMILGLSFLVLSPLIMAAVDTPVLYAVPILLMVLISIPITTISGYFNGKNMLIKLGSVAVISASLQFSIGILSAILFQNGLVTLVCMSLAQIIAVIALYVVYSRDNLPTINSLIKPLPAHMSRKVNQLIRFTIVASFAIMAVNILQIADLLIIQHFGSSEAKFYTDIYVFSRIVFFSGMIFVWPFLGRINMHDLKKNVKPFSSLLLILFVILAGTLAALFIGGQTIMHILFGEVRYPDQLNGLATLSVLFKVAFLIITAICLYFIVLRSYKAVTVAIAPLIGIITCAIFTPNTLFDTLLLLTVIAITSAVIAYVIFILSTKKSQKIKE